MLVCGLILLLLHQEVSEAFRHLSRRRALATTDTPDRDFTSQEAIADEVHNPGIEARDQEAEAPSPR
jgi:hypothetical protein